MDMTIKPFDTPFRQQVLELSARAWAPVFAALEPAVPDYVYRAFYPRGWRQRQLADIEAFLDAEGANAWIALEHDVVLGWMGLRFHAADRMGEIHILAVDPAHQRRGVAGALVACGLATIKANGLEIAMVETGDDPGHAASRAAYERFGFERWPVARYFRKV